MPEMHPLIVTLAREVRASIRLNEGEYALFALSDFTDALREAPHISDQVRVCLDWRAMYHKTRISERNLN